MSYNIVGLGNAIVDILAYVDDNYLEENGMSKGAMTLIDKETSQNLYSSLKNKQMCSGGSVANTIAGMSLCGLSTCFIGKVSQDELGDVFTKDIKQIGVNFDSSLYNGEIPTARSMILISSDAARTMNTYLGSASFIENSDIDEEIIRNSDILYIEGYLWDSDTSRKAVKHAAKIAKKHNKVIAFTLSDSFCIERHREDFLNFIRENVNIVFCNEDEIKALFSFPNAELAADSIKDFCDIVVVTLGAYGAMAVTKEEKHIVPPSISIEVVDTTGAGDLFAAGFLTGLCKNASLEDCLKIGNSFAGEAISHIGARPQADLEEILQQCF